MCALHVAAPGLMPATELGIAPELCGCPFPHQKQNKTQKIKINTVAIEGSSVNSILIAQNQEAVAE